MQPSTLQRLMSCRTLHVNGTLAASKKKKTMKFKLILLISIISNSTLAQNLNNYFSEANVKGSISIFDLGKDKWIHSDYTLAKEGTLPASTFKIINTLIGLEEGIINGKNDTMKWDGEPKLFKNFEVPNWNKDNDLEMAFKNSTIWYFEEISKRLKKRKYRKYLRRNKYSNRKNRNGNGYDFWNYGELEVTPIEQLKLLFKLYQNELNFDIKHQELVKELMIEKQNTNFILRSKTGWCYDKIDIGWYIGYIEIKDNVIFFATRIEKELSEELKGFSKSRKSITRDIIYDLYNVDINN